MERDKIYDKIQKATLCLLKKDDNYEILYEDDYYMLFKRLNNDVLVIETWISKLTPLCVTFSQSIKNRDTGATYVLADFDVVAVNNQGKLYRRIPEILKTKLEEAME